MKQFFKQADYSTEIMETGKFDKPCRVIPKKDRSRKNLLTILMIFLLGLNANIVMGQSYYFGYGWNDKNVIIDGVQGNYKVVTLVQNQLPAYNAGLRPLDIILSENYSEGGKIASFTVKRTGNQTLNIQMEGILPPTNAFSLESSMICPLVDNYNVLIGAEDEDGYLHYVMSDPEADLFAYKTFDFEYSNQNTLIQKEIAVILEPILKEKGLNRDKENPDLLIFVDFQSERKDQYVPPTQQFQTRYGSTYNLWTNRWESRQYIDSYTTGNYTHTEYIHNFNISMADVQKLLKTEDPQLSIVWQTEYMATFSEKMSHKKLVDRIGKLMLKGFPFSERIVLTYKTYFYTGILFDTDKAGVVAGVVPNSSADIAGIRAGDIIKKSSYGDNHIFKESVAKLSEQVNEWVLKHVSVPINKSINNEYKSLTFRVLYCYDIPWCIYKSPFYGTYISSKELIDGGWQVVYTDYIDFIDNFKDIEYKAANPLIFTIKRHDKSVEKIAVVPKKITDEQYHFH